MNETKPLVSVMIPVYNRADLAIEAINCTLAQDYNNIEIIVGDNCSTDGTFEKLNNCFGNNEKVIIFQNEQNLGAVGNWERCLQKAKGKYVKFLWSDDLMSPDFVSKAIKLLESDSEIAFAYSSVYIFTDEEALNKNERSKLHHYYQLKDKSGVYPGDEFIRATYYWGPSVPVSPGCAIFRREKLRLVLDIPNKIGYVHRKNGAGPDVLMFLEAIAHGEKFAYIDKPCNFFREHSGSISTYDSTIRDGYWTAKIYYLKEHNFEEYWEWMNYDIICTLNKRKVFNKKKNTNALSKYLDMTDPHINRQSVLGACFSKLRYKLMYEKQLRKEHE